MATTIFSYTFPSAGGGFRNRLQDRIYLTASQKIPSDAVITNAYFNVTLNYLNNSQSTMRVHYWPEGVEITRQSSSSVNNYNIEIISNEWVVKDPDSSSSSDYDLTSEEIGFLSNYYNLLKNTDTLPICISRKEYSASQNYLWYKKSQVIECIVTWTDNRKKPNYPTNV